MTQNKNRNFQVGDSVRVKNGTTDPDFGIDIGGWQGQISEIDNVSLSFPFEAEISEYHTKGPLQQGDKLRIHSIWGNEDLYGVIVKLRYGRKVYHFPLCDIDVLDKKSINYRLVHDYKNWFANR